MKKFKLLIPTLSFSALAAIASCGPNGNDPTSSTLVITTDTTLTSGSYASTASKENAVLVNGKSITANLSNLTLNKTGDYSDDEQSDWEGVNAGLLAKGGATTTLDNLTVTTNARGANAIFAYGGNQSTKEGEEGDGTNITISDSKINTSGHHSGGVMVAGHGILTANDCEVTTTGDSAAPIRSDKGGEKMTITGGTYTSSGTGSPAIYAASTVAVNGATLISKHSEGVIIEGKNHVSLTSCNLEDTNDKLNGKSKTHKNIFLYQSNSGDTGTGGDSFGATDCTIKTHYGDDFYITNQTSAINLTNTTIENDSSIEHYFLRAEGNDVGWGESGKNGGKVTLNATDQTINGNIYIDSISTLALNLKDGSKWTGCLTTDAKSTTGVVVTIDEDSSWILSADSKVGSIGTDSLAKVTVNGHKLYGWNGSDWAVIKE